MPQWHGLGAALWVHFSSGRTACLLCPPQLKRRFGVTPSFFHRPSLPMGSSQEEMEANSFPSSSCWGLVSDTPRERLRRGKFSRYLSSSALGHCLFPSRAQHTFPRRVTGAQLKGYPAQRVSPLMGHFTRFRVEL